jgi:hypothetical protein
MSSQDVPDPSVAATSNDSAELESLQQKISSLTSTFTSSYAGLVGNLTQSVGMMQRINGIMEAYVVSALRMRVLLDAAPSSLQVRVVNGSQFALSDIQIIVALVPMGDSDDAHQPVALSHLRAPDQHMWRVAELTPNPGRFGEDVGQSREFALPTSLSFTTEYTIAVMARFPSPGSGQPLEARTVVPYPIVRQLSRRIVAQSLDRAALVHLSHKPVTVSGDRWRKLFAVSPMRGLSARVDWFQFAMHDDHKKVVAQCRIVAHDVTSGELTLDVQGTKAHEDLARRILSDLEGTQWWY